MKKTTDIVLEDVKAEDSEFKFKQVVLVTTGNFERKGIISNIFENTYSRLYLISFGKERESVWVSSRRLRATE